MLLEAAAAATDWSGALVSVVDTSTAAKNNYTQTVLPTGGLMFFGNHISGPRGLLTGSTGNFLTVDVFFIDPLIANSFTRVTNTTGSKSLVGDSLLAQQY